MQHQLHHKFSGEVLPYLEIKKQESNEEILKSIEMPDVTGITVAEASKILKELGLEFSVEKQIQNEGEAENIVVEQLPKKGIQINEGTKVIIYTE